MRLKSGWFGVILIAVVWSALLVVIGCASEAAAQERKVTVLQSELPAVVRKAIDKAFPKGRIIKIVKEVEGENPGQYDVDVRSGAKEYEVEISAEGKVKEIKEKVGEEAAVGGEQEKKWTDIFDRQESVLYSRARSSTYAGKQHGESSYYRSG